MTEVVLVVVPDVVLVVVPEVVLVVVPDVVEVEAGAGSSFLQDNTAILNTRPSPASVKIAFFMNAGFKVMRLI